MEIKIKSIYFAHTKHKQFSNMAESYFSKNGSVPIDVAAHNSYSANSSVWGSPSVKKEYKIKLEFYRSADGTNTGFFTYEVYEINDEGGEWYVYEGIREKYYDYFINKLGKSKTVSFVGKWSGTATICKNGSLKFIEKDFKKIKL